MHAGRCQQVECLIFNAFGCWLPFMHTAEQQDPAGRHQTDAEATRCFTQQPHVSQKVKLDFVLVMACNESVHSMALGCNEFHKAICLQHELQLKKALPDNNLQCEVCL